ncbi:MULTISPECIES: hypothetical protein [Clavibacter]|uniref:Uncharacterized protein n=1 Tax=Clavibacter tessellarius TaxID=31965 RepID=A0A154UZU3_9MICO|nr:MULTISPECIES: hypothetical protein [Clavibacter]KZC94464.1 hypothetical protein AWH51_13160 [Clavibacter michiganensis subsp. tessellarius]MDA3805817.1 hypothetical protein [Clavibacter sp. CT19]
MTPTAPAQPEPFFRRLRRAWYHAPFLLRAFAFALLVYAWLWVIDLDQPPQEAGSGIVRAVVAIVAGLAVAGARLVTRLYHPGAPTPVEVSEAAEDGELPQGADRVAWQGALDRRRREIRQEAWALLPVGLLLLVGLAFLPQRAGSSLPLGIVVLLAVFVPYATWLFVSRPRRRDSVDALLIPLQEQSRRDDEERAGWAPPAPDDRIPPAAG